MTNTIERKVTVNPDYFGPGQGVYVISAGDGYSCFGFDNLQDAVERILTEMVGRGRLTPREERQWKARVKRHRGTTTAYDIYQALLSALKKKCEEERERAVYDLTPQLQGLEGYRVEAVDNEGDKPRRFIVGKSTGWAPCHLEIVRRTSHGGSPARREYHSVRQIERVR